MTILTHPMTVHSSPARSFVVHPHTIAIIPSSSFFLHPHTLAIIPGQSFVVNPFVIHSTIGKSFFVHPHAVEDFSLGGIHGVQFGDREITTGKIKAGTISPAELDRAYHSPPLVVATKSVEDFKATDVTSPSNAEVNEDPCVVFTDGVDREIKVGFTIPDDWDTSQAVEYYLRVSPSASLAASDIKWVVDYRLNNGPLAGAQNVILQPSTTQDQQTVIGPLLSLPSPTIQVRFEVELIIMRQGSDGGLDTHGSDIRLYEVIQKAPI